MHSILYHRRKHKHLSSFINFWRCGHPKLRSGWTRSCYRKCQKQKHVGDQHVAAWTESARSEKVQLDLPSRANVPSMALTWFQHWPNMGPTNVGQDGEVGLEMASTWAPPTTKSRTPKTDLTSSLFHPTPQLSLLNRCHKWCNCSVAAFTQGKHVWSHHTI